VFTPAAFAFFLPSLGILVSLASPLVAAFPGRQLWPHARRSGLALAGLAVVFAIVLPILILPAEWNLFRLMPLCAPGDALGWIVPPLGAVGVYAIGCIVSMRVGSPWIWPLGALGGSLAFHLIWVALEATDLSFVC
jgi:hypothetical protein